MENSATDQLLQRYKEILSERHERFSSDAAFAGAKYLFEKALLDKLALTRDPVAADSLQVMFVELASFVPDNDYELIAHCNRLAAENPAVRNVLDLIQLGDHSSIQQGLDALAMPELVRYYAFYRRVLLESEARRQQAASVFALNADSH